MSTCIQHIWFCESVSKHVYCFHITHQYLVLKCMRCKFLRCLWIWRFQIQWSIRICGFVIYQGHSGLCCGKQYWWEPTCDMYGMRSHTNPFAPYLCSFAQCMLASIVNFRVYQIMSVISW